MAALDHRGTVVMLDWTHSLANAQLNSPSDSNFIILCKLQDDVFTQRVNFMSPKTAHVKVNIMNEINEV